MTKPRTLYDLSKEEFEQLVIRMNEIFKEKFKPEPYFNPDDYLLGYRVIEPVLYDGSMKEITVSGVRHIIDRDSEIDYLAMHDTDVVDILKDMMRRAEKNE
jgi:hypothetical protein